MFAILKTIAPDSLISLISEEYEHQKTQKAHCSGKTKEDDEAMVVTSTNKGKGKPKKYPWGWNCGSKDHYKDKCPELSKSAKDPKKEKTETKKPDSDNAVKSDSESGVAFLMLINSDSDEFDVDVGDVGDGDWFNKVVMMDNKEMDWFSEEEEVELSSSALANDSLEIPPLSEPSDVILVAAVVANPDSRHNTITQVKLYDSGCTKHISPYREDLTDFSDIPPKPFLAANKQSFSATGIGKLTVDLPNQGRMSKLELTDIQYSPEVAYTLISVGNLNEKGFVVKFRGGKCQITDPDGITVLSTIPK